MARKQRSRNLDLGRPEITELEFGRTTHRVAEVEPMDVDGVRTMTFGTIAWGIVAIALLPFWGNLQDQGRTWWLWTAIGGLGLGLMGIEYCKRRRDALQQAEEPAARAAEPPAQEPVAPKRAQAKPAPKKVEPKPTPKKVESKPAPRRGEPKQEVEPAPTESTPTQERPVGRRRRT